MKRISFIIVNLNTRDLLDRCLAGLIGIFPELEIVVVDYESNDGSVEMLKTKYSSQVRLVESQNKGLAHGYNLGMKVSSGDYFIFLGSDAYPSKDAIEKLYTYMEQNSGVGILTPRLVLRDGTPDYDAHRGRITPWTALTHFAGMDKMFPKSKFFNGYLMSYLDLNSIHEIDACISHFMMVRKEVFEKIGSWDEEFFLYGEDIDLCYRVKQAGYKIIYMGTVEVSHYKGGTIVRKISKDLNTGIKRDIKLRRYIAGQSVIAMGHFYKKHLWNKYPLPLSWLVSLGVFLLNWLRLTVFDVRQILNKN